MPFRSSNTYLLCKGSFRTFWRGPSLNCPSLSSVVCPLPYRTAHFGGEKREKSARKRRGRGVASKGGKKEERTHENKSVSEGACDDIRAKSQDIPPKKFDFPGFEGHPELFGPHPFTWKTPTSPENIRTPKFGFVLFFRDGKSAGTEMLQVAYVQRLRSHPWTAEPHWGVTSATGPQGCKPAHALRKRERKRDDDHDLGLFKAQLTC